jgi:hypothetical protein
VQAAALLFVLAIAVSLSLASAPAPAWRLLVGLLAAALAWHPMRSLIFRRGASAVRRIDWAADGTWSVVRPDGVRRRVVLLRASAGFGPWLVLAFATSPAPLARRCYALVDAAYVRADTFRTLRGRLKLAAFPASEVGATSQAVRQRARN